MSSEVAAVERRYVSSDSVENVVNAPRKPIVIAGRTAGCDPRHFPQTR